MFVDIFLKNRSIDFDQNQISGKWVRNNVCHVIMVGYM